MTILLLMKMMMKRSLMTMMNEDDTNSEGEENLNKEIDENVNKKKDKKSKEQKRKFSNFNAQLHAADTSLWALKKLPGAKMEGASLDSPDDANLSTMKIPSSDQLSAKPLDPYKLEVHVRKKVSKEEKLELLRAGRERRGTLVVWSNRQKVHKKAMPLAAKRAKSTRSWQGQNRKQRTESIWQAVLRKESLEAMNPVEAKLEVVSSLIHYSKEHKALHNYCNITKRSATS
ncbi:hypothetical protein RJ641_012822 [Dillenia turbinata]|uniref:Uncharacterized protein n=1 Tax=Dillenia turbinata TaxID=194707 RepID=A0AAN8UUN6_9MAGN